MESPAQFSGFGPADDASFLFDQAPPSAASSSRYLSSPNADESDLTVRLENASLGTPNGAQSKSTVFDSEDTFAFRGSMGRPVPRTPSPERQQPSVDTEQSDPDDVSARLHRLKAERDRLRKLNDSIERSIVHFSGARGQLGRLQDNIQTTHGLMGVWSELMSQTEHTRHLVMDPSWTMDGDLQALQAEQEAKERAEQEAREAEEARLAALEKEREEDEERKHKAALAAEQAQRGRGTRGSTTRGTRIRGSTARTVSGTSASAVPPSGIGRGGIPTSSSSSSHARGSAPVTGVRGVRGLRSRAAPRGRGTAS